MKAPHTVSGPGVDRKAESAALGLSAAITFGNGSALVGVEASFYVRDPDGKVVGRVDTDGHTVFVYGPDSIDRAPSGPPSLKASRSAVGQRRPRAEEQTFKANAPHPRVASEAPPPSPTTKEDSVATTESKSKSTTPKQQEGSDDLAAALIAAVKERVADVETSTNASGMTRLLVGKKAFAYLEKARKTGQPVKIPKPLLAIESDLPKGHGFHATKWGLTRTVSRKAEVAKAAQSLAVAAAAVATTEQTAAA